jgi:hypothetical protein
MVKKSRNTLYTIIRKIKGEYWELFLQGPEELDPGKNPVLIKQKRCWMALKYTFLKAQTIISTVKGPNGEIAVSLEEKKTLFRTTAFLTMGQQDNTPEPEIAQIHELIPLKLIKKAIFIQSIKKALGPDRLTFQAIKLL